MKASGGKRGSDGVVVPLIAGRDPVGGKHPDFGQVDRAGRREGMADSDRSNHPSGSKSFDKVPHLQRRLWAAAKQSPGRRFHALYDRIFRADIVEEGWRRVRANRGAAGVDGLTLTEVEAYGVGRLLAQLQGDLQAGRYRPAPSRRREIPRPDGGKRPLGIPNVGDRIVQAAAKVVLEPIFEADFQSCSYGYRPKRSATDALETIRTHFPKGYGWAAEFDISDFFSSIDHGRLLELVERRVSDRRVLRLLRQWLRAGVMVEGRLVETVTGTSQGGVISPLLANIFLNELDRRWDQNWDGVLVRYADDGVVMCRTRRQAEEALTKIESILAELGLRLHPEKTKVVDLGEGREGFDFLGCHFHARLSGPLWERGIRRCYLHRWPSTESMKRVRHKVKALSGRNRIHNDIREVISDLNPMLRGWGNYFRSGNAAQKFN
ncbi:MAG: group II intron reverse transcriptase/maturase [Acidimicrobiia bacterium]